MCVVCEGSGRECGAPHPHTPSHTLTHPNTACTVVLLHSPCRVCPTARCSESSYEGKPLMGVPLTPPIPPPPQVVSREDAFIKCKPLCKDKIKK